MSYAGDSYQPSVVELARSGNFRAIAHWLNVFLLPHNLYARVEPTSQSKLQILVEFHPSPEHNAKSPEFRSSLVRFICHHLWQLNSEVIEGVQVSARFVGQPQVIWRQSVRVMSPARRAKLGLQSQAKSRVKRPTRQVSQLQSRMQQAARQKMQFRALRSLLLTGTTATAFIMGCWLGYHDAPADQTSASASPNPAITRPDTVMTAAGMVPVSQQPVANSNDPTATLMFTGDVTLADAYTDAVGADRQWAFAALEEARQADVAMVNLEAPFTTASTPLAAQDFNFKAAPEDVEVLKQGGIDIVNLANNHTMDYQAAGLDETLRTLQQAGIRHVGAGRNSQEIRRPEILDVKGQRIAYLGYYDADLQAPGETSAGTNPRQNDRIAADIQAIRSQVDWVVVNYHWGQELAKYPGDWQIDLAHFTIDQGADVVVGHHPHVLQGAEVYKGRPIVYSLGNFIFGGKSVSDYDTAMLKIGLKDKQMKVEFLPVEVRGFQPRVVNGDRGSEILKQIENVSDVFQEPMKSPVILDARTNTTVSTPVVTPESAAPSPSPTADTPQPAATFPSASPSPVPADSDGLQSPSDVQAPSSETPTMEPSPGGDPSTSEPWRNDSFVSPPSPSPSITPDASPTIAPEQHDDAATDAEPGAASSPISPSVPPSPADSLEPVKRRYAEAPSSTSG